MSRSQPPKMLWGRPNPDYYNAHYAQGRASREPLDGSVGGARSDFRFKINDFVFSDDDPIDVDNDGVDDTDTILSTDVVTRDFPDKEATRKYCYESSSWMAYNSGVPGVMMSTIHGDFLYGDVDDSSHPTFYVISEQDISMRLEVDERKIIVIGYDNFQDMVMDSNIESIEARYSPYAVYTSEDNRKKIHSVDLDSSDINSILSDRVKKEKSSDNPDNKLIDRLSIGTRMAQSQSYTPVAYRLD